MSQEMDYGGALDNISGFAHFNHHRLHLWQDPLPLAPVEGEPKQYPLGALGRFADAANVITEQVQAPAPIVAQSILATSSLVAQPHVDIEIDGRQFPTSLYLVTVASSGERKTSSDNIVLDSVKQYERKRLKDYEEAIIDWQADLLTLKEKKRGRQVDHRAILDQEAKKPPYPMMLTKEPSYEGLVRSLHEGLPCMGLFSDEAGRFIGGYAMKDENMLKTAAGLSEIWDGSEITRTRGADKQTFSLHDRRLCMHLMLQPIVAYGFLNNPLLLGQGFLPRCLVVQPKSRIGSRKYVEANTRENESVRQMSQHFASLLNRQLAIPRKQLSLEPKAKALWIELHNELEARAAKDLEPIQAMTCKAAEQIARIAGVLTFVDDPGATVVSCGAIDKASALVDFYLSEAIRIQQIAEEDLQIQRAVKLLEWAFREQDSEVARFCQDDSEIVEFHMQGLLQKGPNQLRTKDKAERVLRVLHDHGLARKLQQPSLFGRTERKEAWAVRRWKDDHQPA